MNKIKLLARAYAAWEWMCQREPIPYWSSKECFARGWQRGYRAAKRDAKKDAP